MKFKFLPLRLKNQVNNIFNKNERLATNIIKDEPLSKFDLSSRHMTTFDSGKLVPIYCKETYAGDIFKIDVATLLRQGTPQSATMENALFDIHFFFVPFRIVWENFKALMGENKNAGFQKDVKNVPLINYDIELKYTADDLASYLGFPQNVDMSKTGLSISSLYFKAYIQIWNDYYRDQNLQSEIDNTNQNKNDSNVNVSDYKGQDYNLSLQIGQGLAPVSRLSDYFSTCLPYPQKGDALTINNLPLQNLVVNGSIDNDSDKTKLFSPKWFDNSGNNPSSSRKTLQYNPNNTIITSQAEGSGGSQVNLALKIADDATISVKPNTQAYSVNDLRLTLALQHILELDARGGTRYFEIILNHFGVSASDARLDRAEFIGGFRDNVVINNIVQSSSSTETSPLGLLGGVSVSQGQTPKSIEYAVKEYGVIMGFVIVRPQVNYSQGLNKQYTKVERYDFYDPKLANIGEQPVRKYEIFLDDTDGDGNTNNDVFGYNEPYADLRYDSNKLTGYLSVNNNLSLSSLYAYTEKYTIAPTLGSDWIKANPAVIGDTLLVKDGKSEYIHQYLGDFYFNVVADRKLPLYGIPGLNKV
nr:MAG: major capsid protein [Microvirus Sku126]